MAPRNPPLSMPTPEQALWIDPRTGLPAQAWWRFWYGLFKRTQADIPYLTADGLVAAGTTQADATVLTADWNEITTTPANSGVLLNNFGQGFASFVWNFGANALKVYPPVGCEIDALGANNPYALAVGKLQIFSQLTVTRFRSTQLG